MARITIHAVQTDGEPHRWTFSERIVAENLDSEHYRTQLLERLSWATAEAEALESPSADLDPDHDNDARRTQLTTRSRGNSASRRSEHTSSHQRPHSYDTSPERHNSMPSVPKRPGPRPLPQPTRPDSDDHAHDLVDAAWLYAWSHEALRPVTGRLSARVIAGGSAASDLWRSPRPLGRHDDDR
jgi:hypothetical protein